MGALLLVAGCIIPDNDIDIQGEFSNRGAVRIVESFLVGEASNAACDELSQELTSCPVAPEALHPGLLPQPFCVCPLGSEDLNAENSFNIFVEDPDRNDDNEPLDAIRGALFLDLDPRQDKLGLENLAYRNFLDPSRTADLDPDSSYDLVSILGRPEPQLRVLPIIDNLGGSVDLCNNDEGQKLTPGIHTLHVVVTDRDWFTPLDADGDPLNQDVGNPDLAAGATYDAAVFVFNCGEGEQQCNCSDPVGP